MIRVWGLVLGPLDTKKVRPNMIHAALSRVLDLNHWEGTKLWSIGQLESHSTEVAVLRINTIGDAIAQHMSTALAPGTSFRFGQQEAFILGPLQLWEEVSASQIAGMDPVQALTVNFVTPTTFRSGKHSTPLLEPARVLHSMDKRWSALLGEPSPGMQTWDAVSAGVSKAWDAQVLRDTWVSSIDGRTQQVRISSSLRVSAFTGKIQYHFGSEIAASSFTPLWSLASLIGLGSYTTRSLGSIEILDTTF